MKRMELQKRASILELGVVRNKYVHCENLRKFGKLFSVLQELEYIYNLKQPEIKIKF
jgi:sporulation-control protein spo0M